MSILLIGAYGQLGQCISNNLKQSDYEFFEADIHKRSTLKLDISDFVKTRHIIEDICPEIIINASAYTAVDKAEKEKSIANLINHLAVKNLAEVCSDINCALIHISTDYVFDGKSNLPYTEKSTTNPETIYGETKLNGEKVIYSSGCRHLIIRTAWLFSMYGNNFLKSMLTLSTKNHSMDIVDDQIGSPTYVPDLAHAIISTIPSLMTNNNTSNLYHYAGDPPCSWADLAENIFETAYKLNRMNKKIRVNRITSDKYNTLAKRPKNSVLDSSNFCSEYGIRSSDWKKGIINALEA